jgi:hypothetical protein
MPFMSARGPKLTCRKTQLMSLLGVKRTCLIAVRMSAFDPKRTWARRPTAHPSSKLQEHQTTRVAPLNIFIESTCYWGTPSARPGFSQRLFEPRVMAFLGGGNETARVHLTFQWRGDNLASCGAGAAARADATHWRADGIRAERFVGAIFGRGICP